MTSRLLECHQSDPSCLARFHHEATNPKVDSASSLIGTITHAVVERLTMLSAGGTPEPAAVVREVLHEWREHPGVTPHVVAQVVEIMADACGPKSRLRFVIEPGWHVAPEWRWALDADFRPIAVCGHCAGDAAGCPACVEHPGWSAAPAFAGTMDRLETNAQLGLVRVTDWKSVLKRMAGWEVEAQWQARVYALAVLAYFPGLRKVTFRFAFLRHGYFVEFVFVRGETWEHGTRAALRATREARLRAVETGVWPETLGESCHWCPRIHRCAAMREAWEQGSSVIGLLPPERLAVHAVALKHIAAEYDRAAREVVKETGEPLPMGDGRGSVLGKKPAQAWESRMGYEETMALLRRWKMSPEQEIEWFRFCAPQHFAGTVRKALFLLMGPGAKGAVESDEIVSPYATEQFAVWRPDGPALAREGSSTIEELDALLDERFA